MSDAMDRRRFLKVLGIAGGGAAALSGCGIGPEPTEKLIPYVVPPEDQTPGVATWYSSTCRECGAGCGLHVKVREGRAIKLEGNPDSPVNHGRLCARGQAGLQGLYNPDRVTGPMQRSAGGALEATSWDKAIATLQEKVAAARGKGIVFITGVETGSFGELVDECALAEAIASGKVADAALDVFAAEPVLPGHPLFASRPSAFRTPSHGRTASNPARTGRWRSSSSSARGCRRRD